MSDDKYIRKYPEANYDDPYQDYDFIVIDKDNLEFNDVSFEEYVILGDAIKSKYTFLHAAFIGSLFEKYSGIGNDLEANKKTVKVLDEIINGSYERTAGGGEVFGFVSEKDKTTIYDESPVLTGESRKPITITLPTADFKKIIEHMILQQEKEQPK